MSKVPTPTQDCFLDILIPPAESPFLTRLEVARKAQEEGPGALLSCGKVPREGGTRREPSSLGGWGCSSREPPSKTSGINQNSLSNLACRALSSKGSSPCVLSALLCVSCHLTLHYVWLSVLSITITCKFPPGNQIIPGPSNRPWHWRRCLINAC